MRGGGEALKHMHGSPMFFKGCWATMTWAPTMDKLSGGPHEIALGMSETSVLSFFLLLTKLRDPQCAPNAPRSPRWEVASPASRVAVAPRLRPNDFLGLTKCIRQASDWALTFGRG